MAGIWLPRIELITSTSEVIGYKSGLALSREELTSFIPPDMRDAWEGPDHDIIRIRAEDFEQLVTSLLYSLGNIPSGTATPLGISVIHKYKNTHRAELEGVLEMFPRYLRAGTDQALASGSKSVDPTPFLDEALRRFGFAGAQIALDLVYDLVAVQHRSPWAPYRRVPWADTVELRELFRSESLLTLYGSFFDQRFVDYIARNFGDIDRINWRKFEGLVCEYFEREGFHVEIGRGRDDDNVDARIWPAKADVSGPPAILVQCKRQKQKVSKVVVKALYADVQHERATSGLIVTTTALSPGAKKVSTARGYPITEANRATLQEWVLKMRTPDAGVFLGE